MGQIREELVLYDRFTNTFTSYIRQAEQAAGATSTARQATVRFSQSQTEAVRTTSNLTGTLRNLAGAYLSIQGVQRLANLSDTFTQADARLKLMTGSASAAAQAQNEIFAAAMRSRGAYTDMVGTVAKLGTLAKEAFTGGTSEIVAFAEQLNKQMVLSGTGPQQAKAAMLQLTQGLSAGVLRGEELNSVLENTPMIAQTIAKYMGVTTGEMRALASEGKVTAEIVKNAILDAAKDTDEAFKQMPMTWAQVWTMAQNIALRALRPVLTGISWLANNIQIVGPAVLGLAGAFAVFQVATHWTKIAAAATAAYHFVVNLLSIGYGVLTGNTAAASAATMVFNSALLASPVTWVVMGVMLLVGALYAGVAAYNKFTDSSISATGIIAGSFMVLYAAAMNNFVIPAQNLFAAFANFLGNLFNDPVAAVQVLFLDMATTILGYVSNVAHGMEDLINKIPGMSVNLTSGIDNVYDMVKGASQSVKDESGWKEYVKAWEYKDYTTAFTTGYNWGANFNPFGGSISTETGLAEYPAYDELASIADSVKGIEKTVSMTDEDLKSLVDMAERRYVNNINLTAQTPVINVNGQNTGNTAADRQNLAAAIRDILVEQRAAGSVRTTARAF